MSSVVARVLARPLVHRAERNHAESAKCYAQALKMDSENGLIMKDLSIVYLQTRNFKAFVDLRWKILGKKPDQRASTRRCMRVASVGRAR